MKVLSGPIGELWEGFVQTPGAFNFIVCLHRNDASFVCFDHLFQKSSKRLPPTSLKAVFPPTLTTTNTPHHELRLIFRNIVGKENTEN